MEPKEEFPLLEKREESRVKPLIVKAFPELSERIAKVLKLSILPESPEGTVILVVRFEPLRPFSKSVNFLVIEEKTDKGAKVCFQQDGNRFQDPKALCVFSISLTAEMPFTDDVILLPVAPQFNKSSHWSQIPIEASSGVDTNSSLDISTLEASHVDSPDKHSPNDGMGSSVSKKGGLKDPRGIFANGVSMIRFELRNFVDSPAEFKAFFVDKHFDPVKGDLSPFCKTERFFVTPSEGILPPIRERHLSPIRERESEREPFPPQVFRVILKPGTFDGFRPEAMLLIVTEEMMWSFLVRAPDPRRDFFDARRVMPSTIDNKLSQFVVGNLCRRHLESARTNFVLENVGKTKCPEAFRRKPKKRIAFVPSG